MKRIGIIGCGGIANGKHIPELLKVNGCKITALCDIDKSALNKTAERLGIDEKHRFTDYKALIDSGDTDAVEICTPNYLHVPIAEYAVSKGLPVNIEKPLALDADEAEKLGRLMAEKSVEGMMCFSYRFFPAVRYAKYILDKGLIGKVVSVNVEYLKSSAFWEGRRLDWRFVKKYAGTGVLGDLGVHLIDMAQLLVGDIKSVSAMAGTIVKQRLKLEKDELADVETDDYCSFMARIGDGTCGNFFITRCALGHVNTIKFDVFGDKGMISFNLNTPDVIYVNKDLVNCDKGKLECITVPDEFKIMQEQMFVDMVNKKECKYLPTVEDGLKTQKVLDALLMSSENGSWAEI